MSDNTNAQKPENTVLEKIDSQKSKLLDDLSTTTSPDQKKEILDQLSRLSDIEKTTTEAKCAQQSTEFDKEFREKELHEKKVSHRIGIATGVGTTVLGLGGIFAMMAFEKSDGGGILQTKFLSPILRLVTK